MSLTHDLKRVQKPSEVNARRRLVVKANQEGSPKEHHISKAE
jgi:hypothetical protein